MKPVLFDLDGTLIDSVPDIAAALNRVLAAEAQAPFDLAEVTSFVGKGIADLVARAMAARGLATTEHPRLTAAVLAAYQADGASRTRIYPGVVPALEALRARGHRLGICTNKPEPAARQILDQLGLSPLFDVVLGGGRLAVLKPDPAPLLTAMAEIGGASIFVGDSEVDAETARRADAPFLLYTEGYRKSPVEALPHLAAFEHFDALPDLVAAAAKDG
ncbi:phosphoglycolate phosphatase [Pseudogemmobacter sonorensis]|uniref:phosphoglycolate phosphatase n=1 Tax=Pseudogemmobacter sonorensis TaxID=2989681 RepID=UPI0036794CB7